MEEHVYGKERERGLLELLRMLSRRLDELDRDDQLLNATPELLKLLGNIRSELFHYEVRATYDTPEVADNRSGLSNTEQHPAARLCRFCFRMFRQKHPTAA